MCVCCYKIIGQNNVTRIHHYIHIIVNLLVFYDIYIQLIVICNMMPLVNYIIIGHIGSVKSLPNRYMYM